MSFALTTEQVRNRTKTVTRRIGWKTLQPGTLLQPIVKGQGLKKGEAVEKLGGPIRVVSVRREPLCYVTDFECRLEGFPGLRGAEFVEMFERTHKGAHGFLDVTRIEFEYVERGQ